MRRFWQEQKGMTLVEVLSALTIFSIVATAVFSGFMQSLKLNSDAGTMTAASELAQLKLEEIRLTNFDSVINAGSASSPQHFTVNGQSFDYWIEASGVTTYPDLKQVIVNVVGPGRKASLSTIISRNK